MTASRNSPRCSSSSLSQSPGSKDEGLVLLPGNADGGDGDGFDTDAYYVYIYMDIYSYILYIYL